MLIASAALAVAPILPGPGGSPVLPSLVSRSRPSPSPVSPALLRPALLRPSPPVCSPGTTIQTARGPVCGVTVNGQTSYLDVPYAAPPIGRLRWRPPAPPRPWTTTYRATQVGPECLAPGFPPGSVQHGTSENCLYLEVRKPAGTRAGENLPVMFEIHGGGFLGTALTDNGQNLVRAGHVVYVFASYRLGILGFLADRALGAHSGDYGLQDQQAALGWVRDNISRFGGDPRNVTIFGESAGGASVCDQVASPAASGLFERGISISGFYNYNDNTLWWPADCKSRLLPERQAQRLGAAFAAKVGCGAGAALAGGVAACLRAVPADTLAIDGGQFTAPSAGGVIGPIVNGTTLPMSAAEAFRRGRVNKVALMIGVGRDEFNGGIYLPPTVANTPARYRELARQQFGSLTPAVLRRYPVQRYPSAFVAYRTVMADAFSVCPALRADDRLSRSIPVYAYEDDDSDSPAPGGSRVSQPFGAYHSAINHLVHDDPASLDPDQAALQNQVIAEWAEFARVGRPAAPGTPRWPHYTSRHPDVMSLRPAGDSGLVPADALRATHNCGLWDSVSQPATRPSQVHDHP